MIFYSLALQPLSLASASPTVSAHSVTSEIIFLHLFHTHILQLQFDFIHPSIYTSTLIQVLIFRPSLVLPSSNFFTVLLPSILTTYPSHFNLHTLLTITVYGDLHFVQIS